MRSNFIVKSKKTPGFSSLYSWSSSPLTPTLIDQDSIAVILKNTGLKPSCFPQILAA